MGTRLNRVSSPESFREECKNVGGKYRSREDKHMCEMNLHQGRDIYIYDSGEVTKKRVGGGRSRLSIDM